MGDCCYGFCIGSHRVSGLEASREESTGNPEKLQWLPQRKIFQLQSRMPRYGMRVQCGYQEGGLPSSKWRPQSGLYHRSAEGKVYTQYYKVVLLEGISLKVGDVASEDGECRTCRVTAKPAKKNGYLTACSKPAVLFSPQVRYLHHRLDNHYDLTHSLQTCCFRRTFILCSLHNLLLIPKEAVKRGIRKLF